MLKSLDPRLTPELLHVLAAMGHGDDLVLGDANFPAASIAQATYHGSVVRLAGVDTTVAVRAILSVLPLDEFVATPVWRMEVADSPSEMPPIQQEVQAEVERAVGHPVAMGPLERFVFYEAARNAFAVIALGERRLYGCFIFRKGVVLPNVD